MLITIRLASFAVLLSWCSATSSHLPVQGDDLQRTVPEIRYRREAPSRIHESPSPTASTGAHGDASSQAPGTHELSIVAASNRQGRLTHHGMDLSATAHDRADQQPDPEYMEDPTHPGRFWFRFGLMDAVEGAPGGRPPLEGQGVAQRVEVTPPLRRNDQIPEEEKRKQTGERVSQTPDRKRPNPIPVHKKETFPAKKVTFPKKQDASRVTITNSSPEKENKPPPFVKHPNPNLGLKPNPVSSQKPNTHHPQQRIPPPSPQQDPSPSHQRIPPPSHQRIPPPPQQRIPPPSQQRIPPPSQQRIPPPSQQRIPPPTQQRIPPPTQQRIPPPSQQRIPPPSQQRIPPPTQQRIPPSSQQRIPPSSQQRIPPPSQQRIPPPSQQRIPPPTQQRIPARPPQRIPAPPRPQRPLSRPSGGIHAIPAPNNGRPAIPSVITGSRRPSQPIRPPGGVGSHLPQGFRPTTVPSRRRPVTPQGRPAPPRIITAAERLDNSAKPQSFDLFASASLNFGGRPPVAPGTPSDVVVGYFKKDEPNGVRGARLFNELNKGRPAFQPPGPGSQVRQVIQVGAHPKPNLSRPQPFAQSQANFHAHPATQTNQVGRQRIVVPSPVRQSPTVQRVTAGQITSGGQAQRTRPHSDSGHPRKPQPPAPVQISAPELDVRKPVAAQSDLGHSGQTVSNGDDFTVQHSEQINTLLGHESSRQVQQDAPPNSSTSALAGQADSDSKQGKIENIGHTGGVPDGPNESAKLRPTPIHSPTHSSTSVGSGNISIPPGHPKQRLVNKPNENQNRRPANPTPVQNHPNSPSFPGKEAHRLPLTVQHGQISPPQNIPRHRGQELHSQGHSGVRRPPLPTLASGQRPQGRPVTVHNTHGQPRPPLKIQNPPGQHAGRPAPFHNKPTQSHPGLKGPIPKGNTGGHPEPRRPVQLPPHLERPGQRGSGPSQTKPVNLRPPPPLPPQKHSPQGNAGKHIGRPSAVGAAPGHSPKHPHHPGPGPERKHPASNQRPVIPGGNAPPLRVPSQPRRPIVHPPGPPAHPRPSSRRDGPRLPPRPPPKTGLRPPGAPRPLPPSEGPAPPKTGLRPPPGAPRPPPPGRVPAPSTAGGLRPSGALRPPGGARPTPVVGPAARVPLQPPQGSRRAPITDRHDGSSAFHQQYYHGNGGGKHPQALSHNQGYKYVPAGYEAYHGYPYNVEGHNYGKDFTLSVPGYGRDQIHAQRPAGQGHGQNQGHSHGLGQGHGSQGYRHSHMHGYGPGHDHGHGHGGQSYPRIPHTHVPLSSPQHTGHSQVHQGHSHQTNSEHAVSHISSESSSLSADTDYSTEQTSNTKDTVANETKLTNATDSDNISDKETKTNEDGEPGAEYSSNESSSDSSSDSNDSSSDEKAGPKEPLVTSGSYTAPAPEPVHEGDLVHEYSDYDNHGDYHEHDDYHDDGGYDGYVDSSGNDFGRYH